MRDNRKTIFNILFTSLITCTALIGFGNRTVYLASGSLLFIISFFLLLKSKNIKDDETFYKIISIWCVYNIVTAFTDLEFSSLYTAFVHIGIVIYFLFLLKYLDNNQNYIFFLKYFKLLHFIILSVLLLLAITNSVQITEYETLIYVGLGTIPFAANTNTTKSKNIFTLFLLSTAWAIISYIIGARAQIFSFVLFFLSFLSITTSKISKRTLNIIFILYFIVLNLFPIVYINLSDNDYGKQLTQLSLEYTSSRFFSGRDQLWKKAYSKIDSFDKALFGIGFKNTDELIKENGMSLHNLYVTCLLEGGVLFILLIGILLFAIWRKANSDESMMSKLIMAALIAILYKQSFDISLIENNICFAIIIWSMLATGLQREKNNKTIEATV